MKEVRKNNTKLSPEDLTINRNIKLGMVRNEIIEQYGSIYNYCQYHKLEKGNVSRFLNKKCPISLKQLVKHLNNLGLRYEITIYR